MRDGNRHSQKGSHSVPFLSHTGEPNSILDHVERFATGVISNLPSGHRYHSLEHTKQVVHNAEILASAVSLSPHQSLLALLAAWLHDVGFAVTYFGHEEESCKRARSVLTPMLHEKDIRIVESAIRATKIPQQATNAVSKVVCDADLLYLGGNEFSLWSGRLREEHLQVLGRTYTDLEWIDVNLNFMRGRRFYTAVARSQYDAGLERNFRALETMKLELLAPA